MWVLMMIGMMTSSVAPMILIYARVGRQAATQDKPFAASGWFAAGYLLAWTGISLVATSLQWALERAALLTPMMESASNILSAIVLILAGLYQWTPLRKRAWPIANPRSSLSSGRAAFAATRGAPSRSASGTGFIASAAAGR
jgi:predicted metal-binding membrane protein